MKSLRPPDFAVAILFAAILKYAAATTVVSTGDVAASALHSVGGHGEDDFAEINGSILSVRELSSQVPFLPPETANCIPSGPCSDQFFAFFESQSGPGPVVIPCGSCVVIDPRSIDSDGKLDLPHGLDVHGKLVFPQDMRVNVVTPFVFVQGELELFNSQVVSPENESVRFTLTGSVDTTVAPVPHNSASCPGGKCPIGKKAFVVAGGRLNIRAYPGGNSCRTWTTLRSFVGGAMPVPSVGEYIPFVSPPEGCDASVIDRTFNFTFGDWTGGEDDASGAICTLVEEDPDGNGESYMSVSGRRQARQGPTIDLTQKRSCLIPNVDYIVTAEVMLTKDGDVNDGTTQTMCSFGGGGCLRVQNWVRYWDDTEDREVPNRGIQIPATAGNYGQWMTFTATLSFSSGDLDPSTIYNALLFDGPEDGVSLSIRRVSVSLPPPSSYDGPNESEICRDLVNNGDAEGNGMHAHPVTVSNDNGRALIVQEEDGNRHYRHVGRSNRYDSLRWPINSACVKKNQVYRTSAKVRVHSSSEITIRFKMRRCLDSDCDDFTLAECALQNLGDEWVTCTAEVTFSDDMETGAISHQLRYQLDNAVSASDESAHVDLDNVSVTFVSGPSEGMIVSDDVSRCWGPGSKILITGHTTRWGDDHQAAVVSKVVSNDDGTSRLELEDSVIPVTTAAGPPSDLGLMASEVALLTRNVIIEGATDDDFSVNPTHGGYLSIFHTPGMDQIIEGVQFRRMGQQGIENRFPVHFHRNGVLGGTSFSQNSIVNSFQRCVVVEDTHGMTIEGTVSYDHKGHCYVTHDGGERDNIFQRNLGAMTGKVTSGILSGAWREDHPATFYIRGPRNHFMENVAAGSYSYGWYAPLQSAVTGESAGDYVKADGPRRHPLSTFANNVAHSNRYGFRMDNHARDNKSIITYVDKFRVYRNWETGFYGYYCKNLAIRGGFFADNRIGMNFYKSVGISEISNVSIHGETPVQRDLVETQGVPQLGCTNTWPVRGIYLTTYRHYAGYGTTEINNVRFDDFNQVSGCSGSAPLFFQDTRKDEHFDFPTYLTNVTVIGGDENDLPYPLRSVSACLAKSKGIDDMLLTDLTGSFDPDTPSSFGGVGSFVTDKVWMTAFAGGPCVSYPDMCMSYCRDTCLRTVSFFTDDSGTKDWTMRVTERGGQSRSVVVPNNYYNTYNNQNTLSSLYVMRRFSVSLPSGLFDVEFLDGGGNIAWPTFAEEFWTEAPPCAGHANPGDVTVIVPDPPAGFCDDLIRNGDLESGDLWHPWQKSGGNLEMAEGMGVGGSTALKLGERSRSSDYGMGQYLDTRCLRDNMFRQYEFRAYVKLYIDESFFVCDPNSDDQNGLGCPEVSFRSQYYVDIAKKDSFSRGYQYPKAEFVRPNNPDEFQLLQGVITIDDYNGLPIEEKSSVFWSIENYKKNVDMIVDNVTFVPIDDSCNDLVLNGDFATGTSEYWRAYRTHGNAKLEMVAGAGPGSEDKALKVYDKNHYSYGLMQYIKIGCLTAGERYVLRAKFKTEDASGSFDCNPDTNAESTRCPQAWLKSYRRSNTADTTDYERLSYAVNSMKPGGWSLIEGAFVATEHMANAEELQLYFSQEKAGLSVTYDDVSLTPLPKTCDNLILNPTFDEGTTSFWRIDSRGQGKIDLISPGAGYSPYAARVYDRTHRNYGFIYEPDHRCLEAGNWWTITTKFKLLDVNGQGVMCDINRKSIGDTNCPLVIIYACGSSTQLWNELLISEWQPNAFNEYSYEFPVDQNLAGCGDVRIYVEGVNSVWDIVIDDFTITKKTDAPTTTPTMALTKEPTFPATIAPTIDGTQEPTSLPTSDPTQLGATCPPADGTPKTLGSGTQFLSIVGTGQLCTLTKKTADPKSGDVTAIVPLARSYDEHEWSNAAGPYPATMLIAGWNCYTNVCKVQLPDLGENEEYVLTSYDHSLPQSRDEVARFLESSTFGTTTADLDNWNYDADLDQIITAWVADQMDVSKTPILSHREYWRRRANSRWTSPDQVGRPCTPCAPNARWRRFTFTEKDRYTSDAPRYLTLSQATSITTGETKYILSIKDQPRTTVANFNQVFIDGVATDYTFNTSYPYEICGTPYSWVGGRFRVKVESGDCYDVVGGNPAVDFDGFDSYALHILRLPNIGTGDSELKMIDEKYQGNDEFILTNALIDAKCYQIPDVIEETDPPILGQLDNGTWMHYDPRLLLEENTLTAPLQDGGGGVELSTAGETICSNAPRTFLNFDEYTLSTEGNACGDIATSVTEITLDDDNIRILHDLSKRYVYGILGLKVKQIKDGSVEYEVNHPCTPGLRSRWEKSPSPCANPTTLQPSTNQSLTDLILQWGDDDINMYNPRIRDLYFPKAGKTCDTNVDINIEIQIEVGSDCWTHVHPDHLSVYDMTYWTLDHTHPGNVVAAEEGEYNPIKKWMDLERNATLTFPSIHPENAMRNHGMVRWDMHNIKFTYVGRMYDKIRFRDLPNEIRLDEVAEYYNATGDIVGSGILVCGSPGEVPNDASFGSGFDVTPDGRRDVFTTDLSRAREVTWTMAVISAQDQLRQRMAWALNQILVVVKVAIASESHNTEVFLNYYDIFVRHAFGNYRDILKEISYSPLMGENLSFLQSKSHAYMREKYSKLTFADENFAREVMQLFTIGMIQLNMNGTTKIDNNSTVLTYTNDHIMNFARVWTGFDYQKRRGNTEDYSSTNNRLDPMKIVAPWRDKFPKLDLDGGYIGDGYPLCVYLPGQMFLKKGATYRLLGNTPLPELMEDDAQFLDDPTIQHFILDDSSELKSVLCGEAGPGCLPVRNQVTLDEKQNCVGDECHVDTVRVVQVAPDLYYEYVRPACVELAFYNNAKKINHKKKTDAGTMCANPLLPVAQEACCPQFLPMSVTATMNNKYDGERMTYATAESRCENLCDYDIVDTVSHKSKYHWTDDSCSIQIKVNGGDIAIVYKMLAYTSKVMHVDDDTLNFFSIIWNNHVYPSVENSCGDGSCTVLPEGGCLCDTVVSEDSVFSSINMPTSIDSVLSSLHIGGTKYGIYSSETDTVTSITIHKMNGRIDSNTIFEVTDDKGVTHLLRNVESTVRVIGSGFYFRNTPHFMSFIPSETDVRDAQYETEAALDHYFYQDNTAPFLSIRFIQRFGVSNPTPKYVEDVSTAFKSGTYSSNGLSFGEGRYGDLASTIAAVLLHPESRTVVLDADPSHGSLREPLIKIISVMRNLDFAKLSDSTMITLDNLDETIGQMAHEFPTVFSFFLPEYIPPGPLNDASLVSPEAMVMDMPKIINTLNGLFSMIKYGLEDRNGGFGKNRSPSGYLTHVPLGNDANTIVNELATLLTSGRLHQDNRNIIANAYNNANPDKAVELVQQLITTSPEFHSTNLIKKSGEKREIIEDKSHNWESYKAVVYLMFAGGCDSFNMLIPHTCTPPNDETVDLNKQYNEVREEVHLVKDTLLQINATNQPCDKFGIHPQLKILKELYDDSDAVFIANAGVLNKPVDKENYKDETETQLFAHNTMQREAKRVDPFEVYRGTGVMGRMRDVLNRNNFKAQAISVDLNSIALIGGPGSASPFIISSKGLSAFNENPAVSNMRDLIEDLNNATIPESGLFAETWSAKLVDSLKSNEDLKTAYDSATLSVSFPDTSPGKQLGTVAKMIDTHTLRGVNRDTFYVQMGGFDTHSEVEVNLEKQFILVEEGLRAFRDELINQSMWGSVVLVESSDFGRTLSPNSGRGTDHAWGGNYFMIGGALNGGHILGDFPDDLTSEGALNIGRGRLIPTTPYDSFWNGVSQWMGIEDEADLLEVCPNRNKFGANKLFTDLDLFQNSDGASRGRERKMYLRK